MYPCIFEAGLRVVHAFDTQSHTLSLKVIEHLEMVHSIDPGYYEMIRFCEGAGAIDAW